MLLALLCKRRSELTQPFDPIVRLPMKVHDGQHHDPGWQRGIDKSEGEAVQLIAPDTAAEKLPGVRMSFDTAEASLDFTSKFLAQSRLD